MAELDDYAYARYQRELDREDIEADGWPTEADPDESFDRELIEKSGENVYQSKIREKNDPSMGLCKRMQTQGLFYYFLL
jgi:hypothetical protein